MKKKLLPTAFTVILILGVELSLAPGCAKKIMPPGAMAVTVGVTAKLPVEAAGGGIDQFRLTVRARDFNSDLTTSLQEINGYLSGQIEVPAGKGRLFVVEALDFDTVARAVVVIDTGVVYRGQAAVDISPLDLDPVVINLVLRPASPLLRVTPRYATVTMGDTVNLLELNLYVHRAMNLNSAILNLGLFNLNATQQGLPMSIETIFRRDGSDSSVWFLPTNFGDSAILRLYHEGGLIVDSSTGDGYLATVRFRSHTDWGPNSASGEFRFTSGMVWGTDLYDDSGVTYDSVPHGRVNLDGATIHLVKLPVD